MKNSMHYEIHYYYYYYYYTLLLYIIRCVRIENLFVAQDSVLKISSRFSFCYSYPVAEMT